MSQAVQAALPWIVCAIAAAILIPGIIDFLRKRSLKPMLPKKKKPNRTAG